MKLFIASTAVSAACTNERIPADETPWRSGVLRGSADVPCASRRVAPASVRAKSNTRTFMSFTPHVMPGVETTLRRVELGIPAPLLLHQIILNAAYRLDRREELLPRADAFAEQHAIALLLSGRTWRPVLEVDALDAAGVRFDPRDRISARFETRAHVELED